MPSPDPAEPHSRHKCVGSILNILRKGGSKVAKSHVQRSLMNLISEVIIESQPERTYLKQPKLKIKDKPKVNNKAIKSRKFIKIPGWK